MQAILEKTHTRTVRSCAWSPSGNLLATASFDATTAIWENVGGDFECVSTLEVYMSLLNVVTVFMLKISGLKSFPMSWGVCFILQA